MWQKNREQVVDVFKLSLQPARVVVHKQAGKFLLDIFDSNRTTQNAQLDAIFKESGGYNTLFLLNE